jgi:hypothetical protein
MTATDLERYYSQSYPPSILNGGGGEGRGGEDELPAGVAHFTVGDVQEWVDDHADQADEVLDAEQARGDAARVTLVRWLEGFIAHRDDDDEDDDDD